MFYKLGDVFQTRMDSFIHTLLFSEDHFYFCQGAFPMERPFLCEKKSSYAMVSRILQQLFAPISDFGFFSTGL